MHVKNAFLNYVIASGCNCENYNELIYKVNTVRDICGATVTAENFARFVDAYHDLCKVSGGYLEEHTLPELFRDIDELEQAFQHIGDFYADADADEESDEEADAALDDEQDDYLWQA